MPTDVPVARSLDLDSVEFVRINYAPPELPDSGFHCLVIVNGVAVP